MSSSALTFPTAGQKGGHAIFYDFWFSHCNGNFHASDYLCTGSWVVQAGHLTWPFWHRRPDINRRTMDRALLLLFPSAAANWRRRSLPPFLPFYFLSTRHNTQSTTVSKSHECPPFINCACVPVCVCVHPLYWHGVFSLFSFLRRTSSKKEVGTTKSCRTNDSGCAYMEVMPPLGSRSNLLRLLRDSLFIPLCLTFYSV